MQPNWVVHITLLMVCTNHTAGLLKPKLGCHNISIYPYYLIIIHHY